jgi:hypothetical protein
VRARLEEKPKTIGEKAANFFELAFIYDGEWNRREATLKALDSLTRQQAVDFLAAAVARDSARQRTIMLFTKDHPPKRTLQPAFTERGEWKRARKY